MDISQVRRLLNGRCTTQSHWEFVNFIMEAYGEHKGRAALAVLGRRREIDDILTTLTPAQDSLRSDLTAEAGQLDCWLAQYTPEELAQMLDTLEDNEEQYWVERLGREAVVDLMSQGRVSKEVMSRAILLSEDNYRKFVEVSGTIGHVINTISREVESAQGYTLPENMPR